MTESLSHTMRRNKLPDWACEAVERMEVEREELRQRIVDEHDGHSAEVARRQWEKQCHDAETRAYLAETLANDLKNLILKLQGRMNEGAQP